MRAATLLLAIALGGCGGSLAPPDAQGQGTLDAGTLDAGTLDAGFGADTLRIDAIVVGDAALPDAGGETYPCPLQTSPDVPAPPLPGTSCEYAVPIPPCDYLDIQHIGVKVDGVEIPRDSNHVNGWDYIDALGDFALYGPSCDALNDGADGSAARVTIVFKILI